MPQTTNAAPFLTSSLPSLLLPRILHPCLCMQSSRCNVPVKLFS